MSNFIKDTIEIGEKLNITLPTVKGEMLKATFLPYFIDSYSSELMVVLKRMIMPGAYARTGKKMGLTALTIELPENDPLTIEQAFALLELKTNIAQAIPFGSVMPHPNTTNEAYELILVNIEPLELIDEERGIYYQKKGEYEIGVAGFKDIIDGIQHNIIQDMKTKLLLNELYIMALEESSKSTNPNNMNAGNSNLIGGGSNLPNNFGEQSHSMKTSDIADEVIEQNSQMDYGSIYSKAYTSSGKFATINPE